MNVFLCRLKTGGHDSPNRINEALKRNEIWMGWDVCKLLKVGGHYHDVHEKAKKLFDRASSAPKQITFFLCEASKGGLAVVTKEGGREFYVARIPKRHARCMSVPWEKSKLPGRSVVWLNNKKPWPISSAPHTVRKEIHKQVTFWPFENDKSLQQWAQRISRGGQQYQATERRVEQTGQRRQRGGGWQPDKEVRDEIEQFAMNRGRAYLDTRGYKDIEDTSDSNPYDFKCRQGRRTMYVEVKGATGDGTMLILTAPERKHLKAHRPNSLVLIVHSIQLTEGKRTRASGGRVWPWRAERFLSEWQFTPTQFTAEIKL